MFVLIGNDGALELDLANVRHRDVLLWACVNEYVTADALANHLDANPDSPALLTVLACLHYFNGYEETADILAGSALAIDPDYNLAYMVQTAIAMGLPGGGLREIIGGATLSDMLEGNSLI